MRLPTPVLVVLLGAAFVTLMGLGIWQLQRNDWKQNLVAESHARTDAPPLDVTDATGLAADDMAYRRIRLEGEFQGPSTLSVPRGARLLDVLNHVPVNPEVANVGAVHLRRASIAREQHRTIQESLDRLQRSAMLALSESAGESEIRVREAEMMNAFIERARNIQPLGRVVTRSLETQLNVMLEEGDVVVIPTRTNVIRVGGEVQFSQALMYRPGLSVRDYVSMAGGFSNRAETRTVIVLRPSALTLVRFRMPAIPLICSSNTSVIWLSTMSALAPT